MPDPDLERLGFQLDRLWEASGACNVQLSGGEPTLRDDLPALVGLARRKGFAFIQVNSNGLRLGRDPGYVRALAEAGLDSVYLQFDGADDDVYRALRGRPCLDDKLRAVKACARGRAWARCWWPPWSGASIWTNWAILLRLALELGPSVRGLHLQPAAWFGRFPSGMSAAAPRVTLPETMRALAGQSGRSAVRHRFSPARL